MCLKESCFLDYWKFSSVVPVFKTVGERSTAKNYRLVSLLSVVSKVFEKLVNYWILDHQFFKQTSKIAMFQKIMDRLASQETNILFY